jgi:hypothetical protein
MEEKKYFLCGKISPLNCSRTMDLKAKMQH